MQQDRNRLGRFGLVTLVIAIVWVASLVTRVVLFAISDAAHTGVLTLARAFGAGAVFDLLVGMWLAAPIALYLTIASRKRYPRPSHRVFRRILLGGTIALVVFTAAAEYVFFAEFDGRFNFVATDYLVYHTEVVTNIWESYPLVWVILGIAALTGAVVWSLRRYMARLDERDGPPAGRRWMLLGGYAAVLAAFTFVMTPAFAHVSEDRVLNEVAANGYYTFFEALLGVDAPYVGLYATRPDTEVSSRLSRLAREPRVLSSVAAAAAAVKSPRPLNVVVVLEESFGSEFVSALHPRDTASITPSFDSLANEGALFTHWYSTGNRTIRAIEATTASIPPLPGASIVHRPQSVNLFTMPAVMRAHGYATEFIYGGHALFDGMRGYMLGNGFDRIYDQGDMPKGGFTTAWGVPDEVTFDAALGQLDSAYNSGKPSYTVILSVSNHRPYTYPEGRIPQNPNEHRRTFAVRYSDWAMGRFIRAAKSHAFFENTLFVLLGDHGARVYGSAAIPLQSYEVPVLFYAPGRVPAGARVSTVASTLDLPPTILGFLGITADSVWFGHDVFRADSLHGRALMTHNSDLALLRNGHMAVLGLHGATTVYAVDGTDHITRIATPDSSDRELVEDAIAYFYGADQMYRKGALKFDSARARGSAVVHLEHELPPPQVKRPPGLRQ